MPQLSIVVPTFNEAGNVAELRDRMRRAARYRLGNDLRR